MITSWGDEEDKLIAKYELNNTGGDHHHHHNNNNNKH
jgi:hypothetical protein